MIITLGDCADHSGGDCSLAHSLGYRDYRQYGRTHSGHREFGNVGGESVEDRDTGGFGPTLNDAM
jgi:hypothetical protein